MIRTHKKNLIYDPKEMLLRHCLNRLLKTDRLIMIKGVLIKSVHIFFKRALVQHTFPSQ